MNSHLNRKAIAVAIALTCGNATADEGVIVNWKGAPEFSSADGRFKFKPRGRLYADWVNIDGDSPAFDKISATELRSARLGVEGSYTKFTKYKFEVDFANSDVTIDDAYFEFVMKPVSLVVGQMKPPISLEEQTSSRFTTFMERAAITDAFGLARRMGVMAKSGGDNWSFRIGVFGESAGSNAKQEGHAVTARGTFSPVVNDHLTLHVGGSVRWRENAKDDNTLSYRQRPQAHLGESMINSGDLAADSDLMWGVEAAGVMGPWSLQGEWAQISPDMSGENATFHGGYIGASWYLTGETRKYDAKSGSFKRTKVISAIGDGGLGALQLALRWDYLDIQDQGVFGGKQSAYLVGANWHLNDHMRFMLNYIRADIKDSLAAPYNSITDDDVDTIQLRAQIDW